MKGLIFTYVLTYGGAVVSLVNPFYGLLIYVCFAIIKPESLWHWSVPAGNYSRIVALAMLAGWALHGFGNWNLGKARTTTMMFIGFWSWSLLSAVTVAQDSDAAWIFVEALAKVLLPFLVGITIIDSVNKLKALAWTVLLSQGYVAYDLNQSYFSGFNRLKVVGFAGLDNNSLVIAMVSGAGLAFFLGLHQKKMWMRWLAFVCAGLMVHCIFFGFSRGGMVAFLFTGAVSFVLIDKQPKHYVFLLFAALVALRLAGPEVRARFFTAFASEGERDVSAQSRIDMWYQCWEVMVENPLLGVGPDHWGYFARDRFGWGGKKEAHSLWLQTGAEIGFPGVGFLVGFYAVTAWRLLPIARRKVPISDEWHVCVAQMTIAALAGFILSAQFVTLEGLELPYYITMIGAGTLKLTSGPACALVTIGTSTLRQYQLPTITYRWFQISHFSSLARRNSRRIRHLAHFAAGLRNHL